MDGVASFAICFLGLSSIDGDDNDDNDEDAPASRLRRFFSFFFCFFSFFVVRSSQLLPSEWESLSSWSSLSRFFDLFLLLLPSFLSGGEGDAASIILWLWVVGMDGLIAREIKGTCLPTHWRIR